MPIPEPNPKENKQNFLSRCMSNETMKKEYPDSQQRVAVCLNQTKSNSSSLIESVHNNLLASNCDWNDEWDEFIWETEANIIYDENEKIISATKNGKKVTLNKPFRTPDGPKKFSVYVKNDRGNVVKVNFGSPDMDIKRDNPARRKSFRARHNCQNPGPKYKARYWSCRQWRANSPVED